MTRLTATCPLTVSSMSLLLAACGTRSDPICLADCDGGVDARDAGDLAADARGVVSAVQTNTFWLTQLEAYGPGAGSRYDVAVRGNAPCP